VLPAAARAALLIVLATHVALAGAGADAKCTAARHDCGTGTKIAACCCGGDTESSRAAGPIVAAVRIAPLAASTAAGLPHVFTPPLALALGAPPESRSAPPGDLTILLSNLRI